MSAIEVKREFVKAEEEKIPTSEKSAASTLIDTCIALVRASSEAVPGICSRCLSERDPGSSTAKYPNIFCSERCEREFVRASLVALTLEDCVRMHSRLNALLDRSQKAVA